MFARNRFFSVIASAKKDNQGGNLRIKMVFFMADLVMTEELQKLKELMDDEFELLTNLFIDDSSKLLINIKSAYQSGDSNALRIAAHTLKGNSSNMHAVGISLISKQIEDKAKNNDLQGIDKLIEQLAVIQPKIAEILKSF